MQKQALVQQMNMESAEAEEKAQEAIAGGDRATLDLNKTFSKPEVVNRRSRVAAPEADRALNQVTMTEEHLPNLRPFRRPLTETTSIGGRSTIW